MLQFLSLQSDWLYYAFMPIEDESLLIYCRQNLNPFLQAIFNVLNIKAISNNPTDLVDDVLDAIYLSKHKYNGPLEQKIHKMNLSSFQHFDLFKQTTHMLQSFDARNSNLSAMIRTQGTFIFKEFVT